VVRPVPLNLCMPFRRPIENVNKIHKGGLLWGLRKKVDWVSVGGKPCWKSRYAGQSCSEELLKGWFALYTEGVVRVSGG
jgi:hypothetical protein